MISMKFSFSKKQFYSISILFYIYQIKQKYYSKLLVKKLFKSILLILVKLLYSNLVYV